MTHDPMEHFYDTAVRAMEFQFVAPVCIFVIAFGYVILIAWREHKQYRHLPKKRNKS